jgi:hypothetical protein
MKGRKDDAGKTPWGLVPWDALQAIADVLAFGAGKYGPGNWRHVDEALMRYWDACLRHLIAWKQGEKVDHESGLSHLAHAGCCVLFMLALDKK